MVGAWVVQRQELLHFSRVLANSTKIATVRVRVYLASLRVPKRFERIVIFQVVATSVQMIIVNLHACPMHVVLTHGAPQNLAFILISTTIIIYGGISNLLCAFGANFNRVLPKTHVTKPKVLIFDI